MKFLLLLTLTFSSIFSAPALNALRTFKQADGTKFKAKAFGNQHLNWLETEDGEILKYNRKNRNFEYATIKKNSLKASGTRFEQNSSKRARSIGRIDKIDKEELYKLWHKKREESNKRKHFKPSYR